MRRLLLAALACLVCTPPAAAAEPPLEAEVRTFMLRVEQAARARDLDAIASALASDCRIELRTTIEGHEAVTLLTREEYVGMLTNGFAAFKDLQQYDYEMSSVSVTLDKDPPGATVVSDVTESFVFEGRRSVTHSRETARVERRGHDLRLVAVSAETVGR